MKTTSKQREERNQNDRMRRYLVPFYFYIRPSRQRGTRYNGPEMPMSYVEAIHPYAGIFTESVRGPLYKDLAGFN